MAKGWTKSTRPLLSSYLPGFDVEIVMSAILANVLAIARRTLDEELVQAVDEAAKRLGTTRSGFTRKALRQALTRLREREQVWPD